MINLYKSFGFGYSEEDRKAHLAFRWRFDGDDRIMGVSIKWWNLGNYIYMACVPIGPHREDQSRWACLAVENTEESHIILDIFLLTPNELDAMDDNTGKIDRKVYMEMFGDLLNQNVPGLEIIHPDNSDFGLMWSNYKKYVKYILRS